MAKCLWLWRNRSLRFLGLRLLLLAAAWSFVPAPLLAQECLDCHATALDPARPGLIFPV
jgi:hypothetical protein